MSTVIWVLFWITVIAIVASLWARDRRTRLSAVTDRRRHQALRDAELTWERSLVSDIGLWQL